MSAELKKVQAEIAAIKAKLNAQSSSSPDYGDSDEDMGRPSKKRKQATSAVAKKKKLQAELEKINRQIEKETQSKETQSIPSNEKDFEKEIAKLERELAKKKADAAAVKAQKEATTADDEKTKLYCFCQTLYNANLSMLQCDECQDWYHLKCVSLYETEMRCLDSYCCLACSHKKKKTKSSTKYKSDLVIMKEINEMTLLQVRQEMVIVDREIADAQAKQVASLQEQLARASKQ